MCHIISPYFSHWVFKEFNDISTTLLPHIFPTRFSEALKILIDLKTGCDQGSVASRDGPIGLEDLIHKD